MFIERQIPEGNDAFIDHVGYFVPDLTAAGTRLERLGFRVSLVNVQTNADASGALKPSGTSNRLAKLKFGFLEILAATHDTPLAAQFRDQIARYSGLHLIAFSAADVRATRERLVAAGFDMQEVVELKRRDKTMPDNPEVHFSVLRPQPGVMAEGRLQWVRPHTVDSVWRPDTITTENGATGLTDLLMVVDDPAGVAARYGRYVGRTPAARGKMQVIALDRGGLVFVDPAEAARMLPDYDAPVPFMAGQALRADLNKTRALLERNGISPVYESGKLICVGPRDALGGYMLFHAANVDEPWGEMA